MLGLILIMFFIAGCEGYPVCEYEKITKIGQCTQPTAVTRGECRVIFKSGKIGTVIAPTMVGDVRQTTRGICKIK